MNKFIAGLVAVAAVGLANSALAVYVFTYPTIQGQTASDIWSINDKGQVAANVIVGGNQFAGVFQSAAFNPLPAPPPGFAAGALGINNAGVVVGGVNPLVDPYTPEQGFILKDGVYTLFSHPGWASTYGRAISNAGLVTGHSDTQGSTGPYSSTGWIYNPATQQFTDINPPGNVGLTTAQGMNAAGQVVGSFQPGIGGSTAYLRDANGSITPFRINNRSTAARGINDTGLIAGWNYTGSQFDAFVGNSSGYQELSVPGAMNTYAEGLNNLGQVSGFYEDAVGRHGFIATPVELPTGTTSNGAYTFNVSVVGGTPIFIDPVVAIGYDYAIGVGNPLFGSVSLPVGIGDGLYTLSFNGMSFNLAGGDTFDFTKYFSGGISSFEVTGIEIAAGLNPANPQAFPTELTFVGSGRFTGTMAPITEFVPEPTTLALLGLGLAGLGFSRRKQ